MPLQNPSGCLKKYDYKEMCFKTIAANHSFMNLLE